MNDALIQRYVALKLELDQKQALLREIAAELAESAPFPEGKKTAHIIGAGYDVTVQRRENVKWDQKKLEAARQAMGNEDFFKVFAWEFKPASAKALNGFLDYGDPAHVEAVRGARTLTQGAPSITFAPIEEVA